MFNLLHWKKSEPASAEFSAPPRSLFPVNQVQHQKLNQLAAERPCGWVLMFNSAFGRHRSLINIYHIIIIWRVSAIAEKSFKTTSPQTDNFIEYIWRIFAYSRNLCLIVFFQLSQSQTLKDESVYFRIFGTFLEKVPKYGYTVFPVRWDTYCLVNSAFGRHGSLINI